MAALFLGVPPNALSINQSHFFNPYSGQRNKNKIQHYISLVFYSHLFILKPALEIKYLDISLQSLVALHFTGDAHDP